MFFQSGYSILYILMGMNKVFSFSVVLLTLVIFCLLILAMPVDVKWYLTMVFVCIYVIITDIEHLFMC